MKISHILMWGIFLGSAIFIAVSCTAKPRGIFDVPTSIDDLALALASHTKVYLPKGDGPHPTVIYMHGCIRRDSHRDLWQKALTDEGFAVVAVDSFSPRNLDMNAQRFTVCLGLQLIGRKRAGDVVAAVHMVKQGIGIDNSQLDDNRLGAIGFSHGAWTIMDMMSFWTQNTTPHNIEAQDIGQPNAFKALVLVYPWCQYLAMTPQTGAWSYLPPTEFIRPLEDLVVGTNGCDKVIDTLTYAASDRGEGPVENVIVSGHGHAFDERESYFTPFEPEATQEAIDSIVRFLNEYL